MHFHAGKPHDVLDRAEQVRLAEAFGYQGTEGLLPVEQFMREYFRHTSDVSNLVGRFISQIRPWGKLAEWISPVFGHQMEGDFLVGPKIHATRRGLAKLQGDLTEVLRLADLSNLYDKRVAPSTWQAIHEAAPLYSDHLSPAAAARFLSLLSQPQMLGELPNNCTKSACSKSRPEFTRPLSVQFNDITNTVDEHCLRAVKR
jgi:[protein-PII] uridylyltransferase